MAAAETVWRQQQHVGRTRRRSLLPHPGRWTDADRQTGTAHGPATTHHAPRCPVVVVVMMMMMVDALSPMILPDMPGEAERLTRSRVVACGKDRPRGSALNASGGPVLVVLQLKDNSGAAIADGQRERGGAVAEGMVQSEKGHILRLRETIPLLRHSLKLVLLVRVWWLRRRQVPN